MKTRFIFLFTIIGGLLKNGAIVQSFYINATGGSFPSNVYQEATFAYQFLSSGDYVSYLGEGSTTGKCNIMGYWHVGDISARQFPIPTSALIRDTLICTDTCTVATCGISSIDNPRFDRASRKPLIDFAGSDSLLTKADYDAFPDLQMFPALAGAVVAVYNIPELRSSANSSYRLILSRQNIADIFKGAITKWNDLRILKNNPSIRATLVRITHDIKTVVRTDSSGTSEIFTTALSLFDPVVSTLDYSFASTVTAGPTPKWCGALTDEVQLIHISGCNFASSINSKQIQMRVVDGSYAIKSLTFACDASSGDLQTAFDSKSFGPGLSVSVSKSIDSSGVTTFRVGYSDPSTAKKFWYKPSLVSAPSGVTVNISTLQEGGYLNSHFNTSYFVTPLIESIWVSSAVSFAYNVTWQSTTGKVYQVGLSTSTNSAAITKAFNDAHAGSVSAVTALNYSSSIWTEYQVTFSLAASADFTAFSVTPLLPANVGSVLITTLLDYKNYPVFYDYRNRRGYKGSGRYTCYLQQYNYTAWSYYTGYTNPGIIAEVFTIPYSIGYSVLSDAAVSLLPMASLINKSQVIVVPTASSVSYAVLDKGGNLDSNFNAVLSDGTSTHAWPISGFSYYVIRTDHHIGSCARRTAAMNYLHSFYTSDAVKTMASLLGYATLPDFIRDIVVDKLVSTAKCSSGQMALEQYQLRSLSFLCPQPLLTALRSYLSVYKSLGNDIDLSVGSSDDSRVLWAKFMANPSTYVGTLTFFSSRAQKLSLYTNDQVLTSALAHIAVVMIYHLDHYSACASNPLRVTNEILSGIFTGSVHSWNDTLIQAANSAHASCLPYQPIIVVVRSNSSDTNSLFLRYLSIISPAFLNLYTASGGDAHFRNFDFSKVIPLNRLVQVEENSFVDNEVIAQDLSFGYYLQVAQPTASVAQYCSDRNCSAEPIVPNDGGNSITLCEDDFSTVINPNSNVYTNDLMLSKAYGCYPIVGTVDYSTYGLNDPLTCNSPGETLTTEKVKLGAFLYNGSTIVRSLSVLSIGHTTTVQRKIALDNICNMNCNNKVLGYSYCGYRDCSWFSGDFIQVVSSCSSTTQRRTVTYPLLYPLNSTCLSNSAIKPTLIDCPYLMEGSRVFGGIIFMCSFGIVVCCGILYLSCKYRREKVLKRSQLVFVYIFLAGALAMNWTLLCLYGPNSNANCMLRVWAINLSSTLMFAPLIMKLHRVDVLFRTLQRGGRRKTISDFTVGMQVLGLLSVDLGILFFWTIYARPRPVEVAVSYSSTYSPVIDSYCSSSLDQPFEKIMVAWKACLLAVGIVKAIQTWDVPEEISEAKYFAIAVYNIAVVGSFTYFLSVFGGVNVEVVVILRCVGMFISATVSAIVIMVPKLVVIQLSWAEVFLGTKSSYRDDEYSYSSSALTPPCATAVSVPRAHGAAIQLNLEMVNTAPQRRL